MSGDMRERAHICHRLSVCVQRFNVVASDGSFCSASPDLDLSPHLDLVVNTRGPSTLASKILIKIVCLLSRRNPTEQL
jgi:hypothetical protein